MRDWLSTLFPASFKGMPFFVATDGITSGRRLVVHQFPNRDAPFVEDLGAESMSHKVTGYVVGDSSDSVAAQFGQLLNGRGAGSLSLPVLSGAVAVHCKSWTRSFEKDKLGYIAFEMEFVREGASSGLVTVAMAAQLAFDAVAGMAALAGGIASVEGLAAVNARSGIPATFDQALAEQVTASVTTVIVTIDVIRQDSGLPADANDTKAASLAALASAAPDRVTAGDKTLGTDMLTLALDIGEAGDPELVWRAARETFEAVDETDPLADLSRIAITGMLVEAALRRTYPDRPSGITARADIVTRLGALIESDNENVAAAARDVRDNAVDYLSRLITDLAPVVTVSAGRSLPSLWWAWRLYQDPERATEIAARNRVPHPSFMPLSFEALAR